MLAAGALGAGLLAGCSASQTRTDGEPTPPSVPGSLLGEDWERYDASADVVFERDALVTTVTATAHTAKYDNVGLRADLRRKTLGEFDRSVMQFFATRIVYSPSRAGDVAGVHERAEDEIETRFVETLRENDLAEVRRAGTGTLRVDSGERAELFEYDAEYPVDRIRVPVTEEETLTLSAGSLDVAARLAVWERDGETLAAGGAYPARNFERTASDDLTDAIAVTVDVDLGLQPRRYRAELVELMKAVE